MRRRDRATPIVILAAALAGVTCAFPTDKSSSVFVTVDLTKQIVLRGQRLGISAHLWQRSGADSAEIKNVVFRWSTDNDSIATVKDQGYGSAEVTGVVSGTVTVSARAPSFEKSQTAYITLRVANPLEVDSIRPFAAHYGEVVTIYGVGVDDLFIASLAGTALIEYPFSRQRDTAGLGRISFWVPPPARSDHLFYLGAGVFGSDTATTNVSKDDVFEPNDTVASNINLDLGGPWPGTVLAPILFTNPALAFEPVDRAIGLGEDWFRFATNDTTQALTFFINYPSGFGDTSGTRTFLLDSLYYLAGGPGDPVEKFSTHPQPDFIGSDFYRCKGDEFDPAQVSRESTTVALKSLPSHALHILTFFSRPQRYGLTVARGYFTADPRILADRYEENDFCHYADSIPGRPNPLARIHVTTPGFSDTMNIDNPFELDWYRIEVPAHNLGDSVLIRLQGRPFITAARDTSDIDVYVLTVPGSTGPDVSEVTSSVNAGSTEDLRMDLAAGSYYVAVVDYAGVAMRYAMCIRQVTLAALNRSCQFIVPVPAPPAMARAKPHLSPSAAAGAVPGNSLFGPRPRR